MKKSWAITICIFLFLWITGAAIDDLTPKINRVELTVAGNNAREQSIRVALVSDLHISSDERSLLDLKTLWEEIITEEPDIILLAGDYVNNGASVKISDKQRRSIATQLSATKGIPVLAVLGNHEHWSDPVSWSEALNREGVKILENKVEILENLNLCIRGFGDQFSGAFNYISFPNTCNDRVKVSLTHDPAAAFDARVEGLVFAGHTHCGQIRLPFLGPLYVPSDAPKDAHCGLYTDEQRQVFVSSGVGTSILPFRFLAQAQWDLITLR